MIKIRLASVLIVNAENAKTAASQDFRQTGKFIPREAKPEAERSEVTNRVVFGLITWFAGPGKSSREFVYIFSRCTFAVT